MAVTPGTDRPLGWTSANFTLPATDGGTTSIRDCAEPNGLVVAFICNHCPFVTASIDRFVTDAAGVERLRVGRMEALAAAVP